MTPDQEKYIDGLLKQVNIVNNELERINNLPWYRRLLNHRKAMELLHMGDERLAELARLTGGSHTPLALIHKRNPKLPGHPLLWKVFQLLLGINSAYGTIDCLANDKHWALLWLNVTGLLLVATWKVPTWSLALKGKYNDEE